MDKRIEWIDIAKFYGILLVIIGHCGPPIVPKIMLSSFHMPLFFSFRDAQLRKNIWNNQESS